MDGKKMLLELFSRKKKKELKNPFVKCSGVSDDENDRRVIVMEEGREMIGRSQLVVVVVLASQMRLHQKQNPHPLCQL